MDEAEAAIIDIANEHRVDRRNYHGRDPDISKQTVKPITFCP